MASNPSAGPASIAGPTAATFIPAPLPAAPAVTSTMDQMFRFLQEVLSQCNAQYQRDPAQHIIAGDYHLLGTAAFLKDLGYASKDAHIVIHKAYYGSYDDDHITRLRANASCPADVSVRFGARRQSADCPQLGHGIDLKDICGYMRLFRFRHDVDPPAEASRLLSQAQVELPYQYHLIRMEILRKCPHLFKGDSAGLILTLLLASNDEVQGRVKFGGLYISGETILQRAHRIVTTWEQQAVDTGWVQIFDDLRVIMQWKYVPHSAKLYPDNLAVLRQ
ncbi:hypothetical protein BDV96DRAFT_648206 [Lophiotrema nucula]|uniref:Uncharacterized protein n=1 Tax=Lophiotrema nucula TaxID=690887 RepID=A0A6A5Z2J5_9PLEO|nr:hypothetical protein BDV96DRAFT_648206 [Lophiotrema nucula]